MPRAGLPECLAAVARKVQANAEDVEVFVVAGIDADLAEVHRPRVEAVDALPRFAAVGGLVHAAVLEAVGPLAVLDVLALAAVVGAVRPRRRRSSRCRRSRPRRRIRALRPLAVGQFDSLRLAAALDLQADLVLGLGGVGNGEHSS